MVETLLTLEFMQYKAVKMQRAQTKRTIHFVSKC